MLFSLVQCINDGSQQTRKFKKYTKKLLAKLVSMK